MFKGKLEKRKLTPNKIISASALVAHGVCDSFVSCAFVLVGAFFRNNVIGGGAWATPAMGIPSEHPPKTHPKRI